MIKLMQIWYYDNFDDDDNKAKVKHKIWFSDIFRYFQKLNNLNFFYLKISIMIHFYILSMR
jgi:hypothetical protein